MKCEFSQKHYNQILKTALANGYRFIQFDRLDKADAKQNICILRHDVDYLPEWAILFGEAEAKLGIKSTFFFQICAKTYNLRETYNYSIVRRLHQLGHTIGLHYDPSWQNPNWSDLPSLCKKDLGIFELMTGIKPCPIISFHTPYIFKDLIFNKKIPGIKHAYQEEYFSSIKYLSDSQGWYEGCMCKIFASQKYKRIHLLTHPYIWPEKSAGGFIENISYVIKYRSHELLEYFLKWHPLCKKNEKSLRHLVKLKRWRSYTINP